MAQRYNNSAGHTNKSFVYAVMQGLCGPDTEKSGCAHSNQLDKYYDIINGIPVKIGRKTHIIEDYKALNKHFCYLTLVNEQPQCINNVWVNTTYKDFSKALKDALFNVNPNDDYIILKEYLCCIINLAKALDDFINNHQQYP